MTIYDTKPEIYSGYESKDYCGFVDMGKAHWEVSYLPLKIKVTNAATGAPEANVTITLIAANGIMKTDASNGKSKIVKKTAVGGGSYFKNLADGTYTFSATKPGFKDVVETVNVVNGEFKVLEIKMEKA